MRYVPKVHTGSKDDVAQGLLEEAAEIQTSPLRLHAQNRELRRIDDQLRGLGFKMMEGVEEDDGFMIAVKTDGHTPECDSEVCRCPVAYRAEFAS